MGVVQALIRAGGWFFVHLTTEENLRTGALLHRQANVPHLLEQVYHYFPQLVNLCHRTAGYLSGGEQQMVADWPGFDGGTPGVCCWMSRLLDWPRCWCGIFLV